MSNIYGESATQTLNNISFSGGSKPKVNRSAKVKYVDEVHVPTTTPEPSASVAYNSWNKFGNRAFEDTLESCNLSGGNNKLSNLVPTMIGGAAKIKIYAAPQYVHDKSIDKFIDNFYLHYLMCNAHNNTVIVIPEDKILDEMVATFKKELSKENIEPLTPEASKYAAKSSSSFKNFIFDVYGRESPNNDGFDYKVPSSYPDETTDKVLRRTNRLNNSYYFTFEKDIKVSVNSDMSKASKLSFVAKCDNNVFILKGNVPAITPAKSKSNVITALQGGGKQSARAYFMKLLKHNKLEEAAYKFVGSIKSPSVAAKYYSGNFIHSAFSVLAADDPAVEIETHLDEEEIDEKHEQIIDAYKPSRATIRGDNLKTALKQLRKNIFKGNVSGKNANNLFAEGIKRLYKQVKLPVYMLKADIATSLCNAESDSNDVMFAIDMMDSMDGVENKYMNIVSNNSSPFAATISNALISKPFIGCISRNYTPMLMARRKRRINKRAEEPIENNDNEENDFGFNIIDEEQVEDIKIDDIDTKEAKNSDFTPNAEFDDLEDFIAIDE